jgi:hypothetical protein
VQHGSISGTLLELRNETAFLLGRPDLTPGPPRRAASKGTNATLLCDPLHRRMLHMPYELLTVPEARTGRVEIISLENGAPFLLPQTFTAGHGWGLIFSPDGSRLIDHDFNGQRAAMVWPLEEGRVEFPLNTSPSVDTKWLDDGSFVLSCAPGDLVFVSPEGKETRRVAVPGWQAQRIFPAPGGREILLFDTAATVRMFDVQSGTAKTWQMPS